MGKKSGPWIISIQPKMKKSIKGRIMLMNLDYSESVFLFNLIQTEGADYSIGLR